MTKQEYFKKDHSHFFIDDGAAVAEYCKANWPEDCNHIIRVADEVCRNYYLFDLKWDMERTWEPVVFEKEIDWEYMPGDDPEFIFQFNRHRFFICLGQAYQLTGDEKYAVKFTELLMDWISRVKRTPQTEKTAWRILEVGIRGEYWTKAIRYFESSPALTDQVVDAFYACLLEHAEYIVAMHSPYRYMSNWGVLENHGLFEIAVSVPDPELSKRYADIAIEHLEAEARMQIMRDGVQWEQSPMYHNEVLHCYEDVLILASRNGIEIPDTIKEAVRRMAYADLAWKKPDHHQFIMGDSDDTDIRDFISVAAYLYKDPALKYGGLDRLDYESVWDLGIQAADEYARMEKRLPDFTSAALSDSGNYYLRSGWEEDANLLHFHCGTMGAGHGHSDKLHVDLVIHGEDVLMDAGRYCYVAGPSRYEFKNPDSHNTITVDDRFFTVCKDSWECSKLCQPVKQQFVSVDGFEFVQGGHLGYMDSPDGVYINRKIIYIKPDIYILSDEMYTGDAHTYQQYFHFNENGSVNLSGNRASYQGQKAQADIYFLSEGLKEEKIRTRVSRHYNKAEERDSIKVTAKGQGFTSFLTVICGGETGKLPPVWITRLPVRSALKDTEYPLSMAEAVRIAVRDKEYVVIICHQEVNSPTDLVEADGCMGYGNVIVFDKSVTRIAGTVLNW